MAGVDVAVRYSLDIKRDIRRGHSFAEWGLTPFATRRECEAEWPNNTARYSRELHGWLPTNGGLCAAAVEWAETFEEALQFALANMRTVEGMVEAGVPLWAFACRQIGTDPYGWPLVEACGPARLVADADY